MVIARQYDHHDDNDADMIIEMFMILVVGCTFLRLKFTASRRLARCAQNGTERSSNCFRDGLASMRGVFRFEGFEFEVKGLTYKAYSRF